ncbi:MAG: protoglobin domain-containing protein [Woeseiaceae bacterium]|nr:protoglobin domain-containing protein [Woeseiaceae bacterium]
MAHDEMIEERLRFLEIDQDVVEELNNARQILEPELDRMLEQFYAHLLAEPSVKGVFADEKSIERAREAQKNHWLKILLGGSFESAYFDRAERIGRAHAQAGLTPNWYIGGYAKMLTQFIQHISVEAPKTGHEPSRIIQALCKAVLLDVDLAIHSYLEAKDRVMLDLLMRATRFADDLEETNSDLGFAAEQVRISAEALSKGTTENEQQAGQLAELLAQTDALEDKVKQLDERIREVKIGDRLYLHRGSENSGTFAKLKALILGD